MLQKKEVGSQLLNGQAQTSAQILVVCMQGLFVCLVVVWFFSLSFVVPFLNLEVYFPLPPT